MARIALLIALLIAIIPVSRGDEQPNLCYASSWDSSMPVSQDAFDALKQDCDAGNEDAWVAGWRCHPDNDALQHCGSPQAGDGAEARDQSRSSAATQQENGVIATSTQACIDRGQVVIDELLEADKLIDGETSSWTGQEDGTIVELDNNQRIQRLLAVMEKYPLTYWTDHGC